MIRNFSVKNIVGLGVFLFFFIYGSKTVRADNPTYQSTSVRSSDLGSGDFQAALKVDTVGNVYSMGNFQGTVDFDPGAGIEEYTASDWDIYISKYTNDGTYSWTQILGGTGYDVGDSVSFDSSNNMYLASDFEGTVDFDWSSGVDNKTSGGSADVALTKINSDGSYAWTKKLGGTGTDFPRDIIFDGQDNMYVIGHFSGTVDMDPGAGTDNHISNGSYDFFVTKFTPAGDFVWSKTMGGSGADAIYELKLPANDANLYISGFFRTTVDFDPGAGTENKTSAGGIDAYILKLNSDGIFQWVKTFGSAGSDYYTGVALDNNENAYISGFFTNTIDFDNGTGVDNRTSNGSFDIFLTKYTKDGNYVWVKTIGGTGGDWPATHLNFHDNTIYLAGTINGTVDLDPGVFTANRTVSSTSGSMFVATYSTNGEYNWSHNADGGTSSYGGPVAFNSDYLYVGTSVSGTVDFNPYGGGDLKTGDPSGNYGFVKFAFPPRSTGTAISPIGSDPNVIAGWAKEIMAGPHFTGETRYITSTDGGSFAGGLWENSVHHDDLNIDIRRKTFDDLMLSMPRIPFPWEQGYNVVSEIWNYDIVSAYSADPILALDNKAIITIKYDPAVLAGLDPLKLKIAQFDTGSRMWKAIFDNNVVNWAEHTVANTTKDSGMFAIVMPNR